MMSANMGMLICTFWYGGTSGLMSRQHVLCNCLMCLKLSHLLHAHSLCSSLGSRAGWSKQTCIFPTIHCCVFFQRTASFFRRSFIFLGNAAESVCAECPLLLLRSKTLWGAEGYYKALGLEDSNGQSGKENFKAVLKHEAGIQHFVVAVLVLGICRMGDQETPGEEMRYFCFFGTCTFSQLFVWGTVSADLA